MSKIGVSNLFLKRIKEEFSAFPFQVYVIFIGSLIFSIGSSMAWPYLNIYLRNTLELPLSVTVLLVSLRAGTGILSSFATGMITDRFGRRGVMLISLCGGAIYYFLMTKAGSIAQFALLMGIWGMLDLFYPVGANAMIADLVPQEKRLPAFSILRMMYNAGYAIGPILGGLLAAKSYHLIFYSSSLGYLISFIFSALILKETLHLTQKAHSFEQTEIKTKSMDILRDGVFLSTILMSVLIIMGSSNVFNLLPLYARENFGMMESHIGIVYTVNAVMCVLFQIPALRVTHHFHPLKIMMVATLFYMIGILGFSIAPVVFVYCLSMVVLTTGELLMTPTLLTLTAKRAPVDARGRYMSLYNLIIPIGYAVGPAFSGMIYDHIAPRAIWFFGGFYCFVASLGFLFLYQRNKHAEWLRNL